MDAASHNLSRREMYAEIRKLCAPNNLTNWRILFQEYLTYAVIVALFLVAYDWVTGHGWSLWWMAPVYLVTVFAIGVWTQNRLSCLVHESSHYLLFKNRVLNDIAANIFVCFPFYAKISNYRAGHWGHHRHVNDPENDPDLQRLKKHQQRDFPISKWRFLWEYMVQQLRPMKAFSYLKGRAEYVAFLKDKSSARDDNQNPIKEPWVSLLRIGYYTTFFGVLTIFGWWPHYFLLWLVPLGTFYPAALFMREIAHHGNYPDNGDYTNSRVYEGWTWEREIFFPYGEWNHVLHHMFPTIPWHKTRQAHATMMRFAPYRDNVVICDGFLFKGRMPAEYPTVLDVLARPSRTYLHGYESAKETLEELRSSDPAYTGDRKLATSGLLPGES
jgi:fatty acid desaturase